MTRTSLTAAIAVGALLALAPPALADANGDYVGIKKNWADNNQVITPCRYTLAQIINAANVSRTIPDDNYNTFRNAIVVEYKRIQGGGCVELRPGVFAPRNTKLKLKATPAKLQAGKKKRFTFVASAFVNGKTQKVTGANINFGGTTVKSDANGRVRIRKSFSSAGRRRAIVSLTGMQPGQANVQITRAPKKKPKKK